MLANLYFEKLVKPNDKIRLDGQAVPDGVEELNDVEYLSDGHLLHKFDVYRPSGVSGKLPVVVDIHGGAWVYGDKELNKKYCLHIAKAGFAVVNLSFRLIPEVDFAGSMKDILSALKYVKENADKLGIDLDNAFVTGDSAGGHTAAMLTALAENERLQELFGGVSPIEFKAACFVSAAFNPSKMAKIPCAGVALFDGLYGEFYRIGKNKFKRKLYDFSNVIPKNMCPTYFISAYGDFLRNQTLAVKAEFDALGIENELMYFDKPLADGNKLMHVFNALEPWWEASRIANDGMCEFFKKHVK